MCIPRNVHAATTITKGSIKKKCILPCALEPQTYPITNSKLPKPPTRSLDRHPRTFWFIHFACERASSWARQANCSAGWDDLTSHFNGAIALPHNADGKSTYHNVRATAVTSENTNSDYVSLQDLSQAKNRKKTLFVHSNTYSERFLVLAHLLVTVLLPKSFQNQPQKSAQ